MLENKSKTDLASLGEFGLIKHLTGGIELQHPASLKGVGDDAAVIAGNGDQVTLLTTDLLLEGIHFDLRYVPLKHLGFKAVAVNLSDICAMNGKPKQILVSIGLSSRFPLEAVEELYEGIHAACKKYNIDLIGGDTSSSKAGLTISITAIGEAKKEDVVYRNGANTGDLICVSGDLGGAYLGLLLLEREKEVFLQHPGAQPDLEGNDYILERQLKPEPRTDVVQLLADLGIHPTSMIDISDGLGSELFHICTQSEKGCRIYDEKLPIDPSAADKAREFNLDTTTCMLNGGEDYELLFTIKQEDYEKLKGQLDISVIGHITDNNTGLQLVTRDGTQHPIVAQGWDAFAG